MRASRTPWAAAWLLGIAPALAADSITPAKLLEFHPSQRGVEYDTPADQAAIDSCKVETVYNGQKKAIGYALRDAQGKLLRRFVDTRGEPNLDQWSYYKDGFEVYRDNDLDDDRTVDECRWLNAGGTRVGTAQKNRIVAWKRLSAEEASKVLVQALVGPDPVLLETVMARPEELAALGVPAEEVERAKAAASGRAEAVKALRDELKAAGWDNQTAWLRFDGMMPHLIPADAGAGLKGDLTLYENAVIFAGAGDNGTNPANLAFLQVGEMIKIGDVWKFVDLPRAIDPKRADPVVAAREGGVRAAVYRQDGLAVGGPADGAAQTPEVAAAVKALIDFDTKYGPLTADPSNKENVAKYHYNRIAPLREIVKVATGEEQLVYNKQIADSLAAAYQTGLYKDGLKALDVLAAEGGKIASYAAFRKIAAQQFARAEEGDPIKAQKLWLADLEEFLKAHPKSDEAPEALLQLASVNEFNADEDQARTYYEQLVREFPETEPGKKAAGALRRLDLVGRTLDLKGTGLDGQTVDSARARGKTLLVVFWATWAKPSVDGLADLAKLYEQRRGKGLEIIGVSLDYNKEDLEALLKAQPLPWPQIFEPGDMSSRLANEFGIISLPTMILVDPQGKVLHRGLRTASEVEKQLEKTSADVTPATALGVK